MLPRILPALVLLSCGLPCCSGDDGAAGAFDAPACETGQLVVDGTLDGAPIHEERTSRSLYEFVNAGGGGAGTPGHLDIGFASGDRVHFEFADLLANGDAVDANGSVELTSTEGPWVGNCAPDSPASRLALVEEGAGGTFLLRHLRLDCDGDAVDGELAGCF